MAFETPILLLAWRRPDEISRVIDAIRPFTPLNVYIACDGPNPLRPDEASKVEATRSVIDRSINWQCNIRRRYANTNSGCRDSVSGAITWFFENVEEGIILEDDCVPHSDFLPFCAELLSRYRYDSRVWCISGNNCQDGCWRGDGSYYFSRIPMIWGWATWRRCWAHYDAGLSLYRQLSQSGRLRHMFDDPLMYKFWERTWRRLVEESRPDTWDYQWTFTCLANYGLSVIPNRNLIENIGFGPGAAHDTDDFFDTSLSLGLAPDPPPSAMMPDVEADRYTFDHRFNGVNKRFPRVLAYSIVFVVKKLFRMIRLGGFRFL